jgi:hypothetical protein
MKFVVPQQKTLVIEFQGKEFQLKKPALPKVEAFEDALNEAQKTNKGMIKVIKSYVIDCGLPEEHANELDVDQLVALSDALAPKKNG